MCPLSWDGTQTFLMNISSNNKRSGDEILLTVSPLQLLLTVLCLVISYPSIKIKLSNQRDGHTDKITSTVDGTIKVSHLSVS